MKSRERRHGLVLVNMGEGKGKSSSALGMVFRAAGWGMKVCVIQYIKGQWQTGEQKAAARFDNIEWHALGDGFTWDTKNPEQDIKTTQAIWEFSKEKIRSGEFDLVLLDEINYCCLVGQYFFYKNTCLKISGIQQWGERKCVCGRCYVAARLIRVNFKLVEEQ